MPNAKIVNRRKVPPLNRSKKPNSVPWFWCEELLQAIRVDARRGDVTAQAIHRQQSQREHEPLAQVRNAKDVR